MTKLARSTPGFFYNNVNECSTLIENFSFEVSTRISNKWKWNSQRSELQLGLNDFCIIPAAFNHLGIIFIAYSPEFNCSQQAHGCDQIMQNLEIVFFN